MGGRGGWEGGCWGTSGLGGGVAEVLQMVFWCQQGAQYDSKYNAIMNNIVYHTIQWLKDALCHAMMKLNSKTYSGYDTRLSYLLYNTMPTESTEASSLQHIVSLQTMK